MAEFHKIDDAEKLMFNVQYAVKTSLRRGLDKAAVRLSEELAKKSPNDTHTKTNKYAKSWKINRRYKNMRIVHNTKTVINGTQEIPLSNILECNDPHIKQTFDNIRDELAEIILNEIQF